MRRGAPRIMAVILCVVLSLASGARYTAAADKGGDVNSAAAEKFQEETQRWLQIQEQRHLDSMKRLPEDTGGKPTSSSVTPMNLSAGNSTGQQNYYTYTVVSGTKTIPGGWYFNSAYSSSGTAAADAQWNYTNNYCYTGAKTSAIYGRADGWCDVGNVFNYSPSAPAGTLVLVNITATGHIAGEVATAGAGGSNLRVVLNLYDYTTSSQYASCPITNVSGPATGWTDINTDYSNTCPLNLVSGHKYVAYVGLDTNVSSTDIAYVYATADTADSGFWGSSTYGVSLTSMTIVSN